MSKEASFIRFEFLPAEPTSNSIKIYHPFSSLAKNYFSSKGFDITLLKCGSIAISFESLNEEEKLELANEIKDFLKKSRQKIIKDFSIYKSGF